jgi:hypothetical protein
VARRAGFVAQRARLVGELELGEHEHDVRGVGRDLGARQQALDPERQIGDEVDDPVLRARELVVRVVGRPGPGRFELDVRNLLEIDQLVHRLAGHDVVERDQLAVGVASTGTMSSRVGTISLNRSLS